MTGSGAGEHCYLNFSRFEDNYRESDDEVSESFGAVKLSNRPGAMDSSMFRALRGTSHGILVPSAKTVTFTFRARSKALLTVILDSKPEARSLFSSSLCSVTATNAMNKRPSTLSSLNPLRRSFPVEFLSMLTVAVPVIP